jgi:hypothetical protein
MSRNMRRTRSLLPISKLLLVTGFLSLIWAALCGPGEGSFYQSVQAGTVPPTPTVSATPEWSAEPVPTNIVVLTVSYTTAQLQQAYLFQESDCTEALTNHALLITARTALSNTATGERIAIVTEAGGSLAETLDQQADLYSWYVHLGNFTARAFLSPCTGKVLFAGESIWAGQGMRPYPRNPLPASALVQLSTLITAPQTFITIGQTDFLTLTAEAAWNQIANLNVVHDLAQQPYKALAYFYRPATGYVDPAEELARAEWVFILYRTPSPRAQGRSAYYLPLIRQ